MNVIDFLSDHTYIILPTRANPKVYLPIADANMVAHAFELYNPFSKKAKILKSVARFLCLYMKPLARIVFPTITGKKSKFNIFLEKQLSKTITSSVYIATEKDKIVLQIQDQNGIVGYLKSPITGLGKKRLQNEQLAIELLSSKKMIQPLLLKGEFDTSPFILLQPIFGEIGAVTKEEYTSVLKRLKKEEQYSLDLHPRVKHIRTQLNELELADLIDVLDRSINKSNTNYYVVYEHGDFAPWNLIKTKNGIVPFDFEYFEADGLEYLDELKFHFQEQHLLHQKVGKELISGVFSKVGLEEFDCLFKIFLLKEIANKMKIEESVELERSLLKQLTSI